MRKLYFLLITLFVINFANAQWQQTNILKSGKCFAISGDTIFVGTDSRVYLSTNNGVNWSQAGSGIIGSVVSALAKNDNSIFAGTYGDGVFLSSNNGSSWSAVNTGLTDANVFALAIKGDTIYAGTHGGGVFLSLNKGSSWSAVNTGLTNTNVFALAIKGDTIYAGTEGGVFLSSNNGSSWSAVNTGLTSYYISSITIGGNNIFIATDSGLYLSTNGGTNWTAINAGLKDSVHISSLIIDGSNIFAGSNGDGVFLSSNNGSSWSAVNTGLTNTYVLSLASNGSKIFAGTQYGTGTNPGGVWKRALSDITIGIEKNNSCVNNISIYPNPAINQLTIEAKPNSEIEILNIQGQLVKSISSALTNTLVDISFFPRGMYFIKVKTKNGIATKKFIKQ